MFSLYGVTYVYYFSVNYLVLNSQLVRSPLGKAISLALSFS